MGHIVGNGHVKPNDAKIRAILDFPKPKDRKQLRQFLGVVSFYRRFIPHASHILAVLTNLLWKDVKFLWDDQTEAAFIQVKAILSRDPILKAPDLTRQFTISVDCSQVAAGAVLMQKYDDILHPVAYLSQKLNAYQQKQESTGKLTKVIDETLQRFTELEEQNYIRR